MAAEYIKFPVNDEPVTPLVKDWDKLKPATRGKDKPGTSSASEAKRSGPSSSSKPKEANKEKGKP